MIKEEVKQQVAVQLSCGGQSTSEQRVSPSQRRSSYASTELPATQQDDALQRFPVDDITQPFMVCELHIPMGDSTVLVAHGVVAPEQPNRTPRIHGSLIPLDIIELVWIELSAPIGEWLLTLLEVKGRRP
jgi:hypothetical protein